MAPEQAEAEQQQEQAVERTCRIDTCGFAVHHKASGYPTAWVGNSGEANVSERMVEAYLAGFKELTGFKPKGRTESADLYEFDLGDVKITRPDGHVEKHSGILIRGCNLAEVRVLEGMILSMEQSRLADHA